MTTRKLTLALFVIAIAAGCGPKEPGEGAGAKAAEGKTYTKEQAQSMVPNRGDAHK